MASTSTPMPPSQWVKERQNRDPTGQRLDVHQDGGPCCGKARAGLKDTVHKGLKISGEVEGQPAHHTGDQPDQPHRDKALTKEKVLFCAHGGQGQADGQDDQMLNRKGTGLSRYRQATAIGKNRAKDSAAITRPTSLRTSLMFIASSRDREGALILIDVVQVQDTQIPGDQDH